MKGKYSCRSWIVVLLLWLLILVGGLLSILLQEKRVFTFLRMTMSQLKKSPFIPETWLMQCFWGGMSSLALFLHYSQCLKKGDFCPYLSSERTSESGNIRWHIPCGALSVSIMVSLVEIEGDKRGFFFFLFSSDIFPSSLRFMRFFQSHTLGRK